MGCSYFLPRLVGTSIASELMLTKVGLSMAVDAAGLEAAMAIKNRNQLMCSRTEDVREGMMVFIDKRPTNFQGR